MSSDGKFPSELFNHKNMKKVIPILYLLFTLFYIFPLTTNGQTTLFEENFENNPQAVGWLTLNASNSVGWEYITEYVDPFWGVPAHTTFAISNDHQHGCPVVDTCNYANDYLVSPLINLGSYNTIMLDFDSYFFDFGNVSKGYLFISNDGGIIWDTIFVFINEWPWQTKQFDISQYAGQSINLAFFHYDSDTYGTGLAIDNVKISGSNIYEYSLPYTENFDNEPYSNGWASVNDTNSGGWKIASNTLSTGFWTIPEHGVFAFSNDNYWEVNTGSNYANDLLVSPTINLQGSNYINLEFDYFLHNFYNPSEGYVLVSTDDGLSWDTIQQLDFHGNFATWDRKQISLNAYSNQSIKIAFYHFDNNSSGMGFAVDSIVLYEQEFLTAQLPFYADFENASGDSLWNLDNEVLSPGWAFGTDLGWPVNQLSGTSRYAGSNDAEIDSDRSNDWLISPLIPLIDIDTAYCAFDAFLYGVFGSIGKVYISTDFGDTWTEIFNIPSSNDFVSYSIDISSYIGSDVLIGFYHTDTLGNDPSFPAWADIFAIDNVHIYGIENSEFDLGITQWISPNTSCTLNNSETITIELKNFGTDTVFDFTATYIINGNAVTEAVNQTILPDSSFQYNFIQSYDFSLTGNYQALAFISVINDTLFNNDTIAQFEIENKPKISIPYFDDFETGASDEFESVSAGNSSIQISNDGSNSSLQFAGSSLPISWLQGDSSNVWNLNSTYKSSYITKCEIDASAVNSLELLFNLKQIHSGNDPENCWFRVLANDDSIPDIYGNYFFNPELGNTSFQNLSFNLSTLAGSSFTLEFQAICKSVSDKVYLDDLLIQQSQLDGGVTTILSPVSDCGVFSGNVKVELQNFSNLPISNIPVSYQLIGNSIVSEIVNVLLNPNETYEYTFVSPVIFPDFGEYTIKSWTELSNDVDLNNDTSSTIVVNKPPVTSFPYVENFNGTNYWTFGGTNSSWGIGIPADNIDGTNCWTTNVSGNYNNNENSFIEGPCYEFTNVQNPILEFNIWYNTEYLLDQVNLLATTDNWLSSDTLNSWSGASNENDTIILPLSQYTNEPNVKFKYTFSTDYSTTYEGFVLDNFWIYQQFEVSYLSNDASCFGYQDGTIELNVVGGVSPYEFLWSNGATNEDLLNISAGTYVVTITDSLQHVLIESIEITEPQEVIVDLGSNQEFCQGESAVLSAGVFTNYIWSNSETTEGITVQSSNTYSVTVTDASNCFGIDTVLITFNNIYLDTIEINICDGETYFAQGANQTVSGIYTDVLTSGDGCDSTILTNLTVNPVYTTNVDVAICDGESYFAAGANQTITGIYTDVLTTIDGCDSTILTNLTVNPVYTTNVDVAICDGETYFAAGANQTITGIYTDVLTTGDGCDSTILTNLTVNPVYTTNVYVEICDGETYFAAGTNQTITGIYTDILTSVDGCDSTILTNLTVNPIYTTNVDVAICDGESYFAAGANQTVTGIYTDVLTSGDGCDSTILTNLTVNPVYTTNVDVAICDGESYFAAGANQIISGIYTDILTTIDGCDSTILTNLTVNPVYITNVDVEICDSETYFAAGANQTVSGIYTDILTTVDGCDSTILTNLTVNQVYTTNVDVAICDGESYFAAGANQTVTGIYTDILTSIDGCDSTILTNLTVNLVYTTNVDVEICDGESYFAAGANQTVTGIYTDILTSVDGCDSTILTNLTVNPVYTTNVDVEICDGESYFAAGANQIISGIYTDVLTTGDGCDSTILTNLTVNPIYATNVNVEICDGESYFAAGANQTITGIYTDVLTTIGGCDSTILTNLTVNPIYTTNVDVEICDGETYFAAGANQTVTGIYTDVLTTVDGCDSTILTNLTINPIPEISISISDVTCFGLNNGSADINILSGTTPFIFNWSNGATTQNLMGIAAGDFFVTIFDGNACSLTDSIEIAQANEIQLLFSSINESSFGSNDGSIDLAVSGGTNPYSYEWSNGETIEDLANLSAGIFIITLTDNNNCVAIDSAEIVTLGGGIISQSINIVPGWNWISFNTLPITPNINTVLSNYVPQNNDEIKTAANLGGSATFFNGVWYGLNSSSGNISADARYLLFRSDNNSTNLSVDGYAVDPTIPIDIVSGWNWIGYKPQNPININTALSSLSPIDNDEIKTSANSGGSAAFFGSTWYGMYSVGSVLQPGVGYLLKSTNNDTLIYPANSTKSDYLGTIKEIKNLKWENPVGLKNTMTIHAKVIDENGDYLVSEGSRLAVFKGSECRGICDIFAGPDGMQFQMAVSSNIESENELTFKIFDESKREIFNIFETVDFINNGRIGLINQAIELTISKSTVNAIDEIEDWIDIYPSIFNPEINFATIEFSLNSPGLVKIEILDCTGKIVKRIENSFIEAGEYSISWNGENDRGNKFSQGLFFCRIIVNDISSTHKIVLLK